MEQSHNESIEEPLEGILGEVILGFSGRNREQSLEETSERIIGRIPERISSGISGENLQRNSPKVFWSKP